MHPLLPVVVRTFYWLHILAWGNIFLQSVLGRFQNKYTSALILSSDVEFTIYCYCFLIPMRLHLIERERNLNNKRMQHAH